MNLLDPTIIRNLVDYSFGDQSSDVHKLWDGYIKKANGLNKEFIEKCKKFEDSDSVMTLFIDNIRLYRRKNIKYTKIELTNPISKKYKDDRVSEFFDEDLLDLCSKIQKVNFIIFTGFEDTPIDEEIFEKIPKNVIKIYASNSISYGGKVSPIPYGIQRKINQNDSRHEILKKMITIDFKPNKLLYINHNVSSNPERQKINDIFSNYDWCTIEKPKSINPADYVNYLTQIKNHKFMVCPDGNAIGCECHRDWEVIYMKRVPIVIDTDYHRKIFESLPVLYVNSFTEITEELLISNEKLFIEMQSIDLKDLDFEKIYNNIKNKEPEKNKYWVN
jgi:hypothetical protein